MPFWEYAGTRVEVDGEGYLVRFEDWNEKIACGLAEREGIADSCPLTPERMAILRFMRDYFQKFDSFPLVQRVCKNVGQARSCTYDQFMDPLQAWKIAGLPKPTTEVFAYLKHRQ
ncbi:MAG: TusE/DsrC/DsvC family sulfur relay protein [Syntrophaceae bacterium]|jgi:tRNA 2-thiouridine synthesizing protein E|nr:TusE/DsrC/DsvC family sulfur relay protein [Syntrophaceae bacterium]